MKHAGSTQEEPQSINVVERALKLFDAFEMREPLLSLSELSRRSSLPKTSTLRLARTLAKAGFLVQDANGGWRLGPSSARLGARYQMALDSSQSVEPILCQLSKNTKETASFFVWEGDARHCIARVHGENETHHKLGLGEPIPLTRGAAGHVILAYTGQHGEPYDTIRKQGYCITVDECLSPFSSIAAPIFGHRWSVLGSISIAGPIERFTEEKIKMDTELVLAAARHLSSKLSLSRNI